MSRVLLATIACLRAGLLLLALIVGALAAALLLPGDLDKRASWFFVGSVALSVVAARFGFARPPRRWWELPARWLGTVAWVAIAVGWVTALEHGQLAVDMQTDRPRSIAIAIAVCVVVGMAFWLHLERRAAKAPAATSRTAVNVTSALMLVFLAVDAHLAWQHGLRLWQGSVGFLRPFDDPYATAAYLERVEALDPGVYELTKTPGCDACSVNPVLRERTSTIAGRVGLTFGVRFRGVGVPEGRRISVEARVTHPRFDGAPVPTTEWTQRSLLTLNGDPTFEGFRFDFPWEIVAGDYDVALYAEDHLLAQRTFRVSPATVPALPHLCEPTPGDPLAPVFALLARDGCYGWCPIYRVAIHRDGRVDYFGHEFVVARGPRSWNISEADTAKLMRLFEQVDFLSLADHYPTGIEDAPEGAVGFSCDGRSKLVSHGSPPPTAGGIMEAEIDRIVGIEKVIGTREERKQFSSQDGVGPEPPGQLPGLVHERIEPGAQRCLAEGLKSDPHQGGSVVLSVGVGVAGDVRSVDVESSTGVSADVLRCVQDAVRATTFEAAEAYGRTNKLSLTLQPAVPAAPAPPVACPADMVASPAGYLTLPESHEDVRIHAYCLDRTEVTASAYDACVRRGTCVEARQSTYSRTRPACTWRAASAGQHPINCVGALQAVTYCSSVGKRLPTQAEWLWAARGGAAARKYPWGNAAPAVGFLNACGAECRDWLRANDVMDPPETAAVMTWWMIYPDDDGWPTTAPVGLFPRGANAWGVLDLVGNVSEWVEAGAKTQFVALGGSWQSASFPTSPSDALGTAGDEVGFRCAK